MKQDILDNLIKTMKEVPDTKRFTMHWFVWPDKLRLRDALGIDLPKEAEEWCGTPACLLGYYGAREDLQDLMSVRNGQLVYREPTDCEDYDGNIVAEDEDVYFTDQRVLDHFGITAQDSYLIFSERGCGYAITPDDVIKFLEENYRDKA